jgi:TolA-binding protein
LAQFWLAEGDYRLGDSRAAGERFDQLAQIDSQERWARVVTLRRAQLAARAERWDDARQLIDELLTAQADFEPRFELDYVRGRCLAAAARFDDARAAFQQVIHSAQGAKTETAAMAQWMMGETYFHQRQYEAALREYLRVEILYAYPQWQAAALLEAAKCYEKLGQSSQAVETCVRLIKNFPDSPYRDEAARLLRSAEQTTEKR